MTEENTPIQPILGVDYYPEHVPQNLWEQDARMMRETGIKIVRIGDFAWSRIEPRESQYDWGWLDLAVQTLANEDLLVVMATPTSAPPPWMSFNRPEILAQTFDGRTLTAGGRHYYCPSSSYYRTECNRLARDMGKHFKENEAVIGWQIDNELGNHGNCRCYCKKCEDRWHLWLTENYYYDISRLNMRWGAVFWGQEWTGFGTIPLPRGTGANYNPSHLLDYYRFASHNALEFFELQVSALRESFSEERAFITHNIFYGDDNVNFYKLAEMVDFMAWDNYPHGMKSIAEINFYHNFVWGLKRQNYWVMEQPVGNINWTKYNPSVHPAQVRLWTLQNHLLGTDVSVFFSWRQARSGSEQYHSAILRHDNKPSRTFDTVQRLSLELGELPYDMWVRPKADVALLFDWEDWWDIQIQPHNAAFDYLEVMKDVQASLWRRYIACDIIKRNQSEGVFRQYKLIVAPAAILGSWEEADTWRRYVETGGKLLLISRCGAKEPSGKWSTDLLQPMGVVEWLGLQVAEFLSFPPYAKGNFEHEWLGNCPTSLDEPILLYGADGKPYAAKRLWAEIIEPQSPDCEVLLRYKANNSAHPEHIGDFFAGAVALAGRELGRDGKAFYLGVLPVESNERYSGLYDYLWDELLKDVATPAIPGANRVEGVEILRVGTQGQYVALLNHTNAVATIKLNKTYRHVQSSDTLNEISLAPFGVDFIAELL
jgi:beta-galactosidase